MLHHIHPLENSSLYWLSAFLIYQCIHLKNLEIRLRCHLLISVREMNSFLDKLQDYSIPGDGEGQESLECCSLAVYGVGKSQTWLSDWTTMCTRGLGRRHTEWLVWFLSLDLTHTDSTSLLDAEFPKNKGRAAGLGPGWGRQGVQVRGLAGWAPEDGCLLECWASGHLFASP